MFCGECGTKNSSGSKFCENCGAKIEQETTVEQNSTANMANEAPVMVASQPVQAVNTIQQFNDTATNQMTNNQKLSQTQKKPMSKKNKMIIGIIVAIVAVIAGCYYYVSTLTTPEKIAESYFNAVIENDAKKIYKFIDVEKSKFTTEKMFEKVVKNSTSKEKNTEVVNYQVGKPQYKDLNKMTATVTITYVLKDSEKSQTMDVKLTKSKEKKWVLFENWLVSTAAYTVADDFEIRVNKNSKVSIEGETLGKDYFNKEDSTTSTDVYTIPKMFAGKYIIKIALPIGIEIEEAVNISSGSYYYPLISSSTLTKKSTDKLAKQAIKDLQLIYDSAINKKTFEDIKSSFEYKDCNLSNLSSAYQEFTGDLSTATVLTKIKFTDATVGSIYTNADNTFSVSVTAKSNYTVSYNSLGETKTHEDTSSDYITLYYDYVDGQYKLINVKYLETYFSRY